METPNPTVNPSSIVDILTLRYDTSIQPNLPKKSWEDFVPIDNPPSIPSIETSICAEIETNLEDALEKVNIALSIFDESTQGISNIIDTKAEILWKLNRIDEALEEIEKSEVVR